jgi:sulfur carrier protein ThiS
MPGAACESDSVPGLLTERSAFDIVLHMDRLRIEINLYASLRKWRSEPNFFHEVTEAGTVKDALLDLGIPEEDVAIIMINRRRGQPDDKLSEGDRLDLFPLIGGG